ncbi:MAG TPA: hypothetical protein VHM30_15150 [Gemmatimonadaceae bacterium]|nr:hypothetical protein [Gemmatimonadaceae bacterium]
MLFTLEALEAAYGDCLLLHYGTPDNPRTIVIDGGPSGIYKTRLEPRLLELKQSRVGDDSPLPLALVAVSHVDEDHIKGILELTAEMRRAKEDGDPRTFDVPQLWHNSFDDAVKAAAKPAELDAPMKLAETGGGVHAKLTRAEEDSKLVLLSIPQGRQLRGDAAKLGIPVNPGFTKQLIVTPKKGSLKKDLGAGLTITIVGPRQEQLDALQTDWAKYIAKAKKSKKLKPAEVEPVALAEFVDKSVYNLSSIVMLAECGGKKMLLTGDARGDYVIQALEESGLKKAGKPYHVDVLKLPHHGSWRNLADEFFEEITADHYVVSANGKYDNPDKPTMASLLKVRAKGGYTIHLTNRKDFLHPGKALPAATFLEKNAPKQNVTLDFADDSLDIPKVVVDLGQPLKD